MKNNIAIIGSGLTSLVATKRLLEKNMNVTIIDVGRVLPTEINNYVLNASRYEPSEWSKDLRNKLTKNNTIKSLNIPKKLLFGSEFVFNDILNGINHKSSKVDANPTFAKAGYSNIWGAAMLPAHHQDLSSWPPITRKLNDHYKKVLRDIPLTGTFDKLNKIFPEFKEKIDYLEISNKSDFIYKNLNKHFLNNNFLCSKSRLAVNTKGANGCKFCGLCLSGCPYNSIYSSKNEFDRLIEDKKIKYINNAFVESYSESNELVEVTYHDLETKKNKKIKFNKIFIAAGALSSTLIYLKSNKIYNKRVKFIDSQKYIFPIFTPKGFDTDIKNQNALCDLFVDFKFSKIFQYWNHIQISDINDWVIQKLKISSFSSIKYKFYKPLLKRLAIGWGGLHSNISNNFYLVLIDKNSYNILGESKFRIKLYIFILLIYLFFKNLSKRIIFFPFFITSKIGGGCHYGGSIPMKLKPKNEFESDTLGRPYKHANVHFIDSTIFPSIPSTTLALLTMANADRIICHTFETEDT